MTIKVNIIKTADGYNYRNADKNSNKLIGTIHEGRNKPGIYLGETFGDTTGFGSLEQTHYTLQKILAQRAVNLGCEIEFYEI